MTTADGADDRPGSFRALLRPFPDQTPGQHLFVAGAGLATWSGGFLVALSLLGGVSVATADTAGAMEARRLAGVLAGIGCGAYLGVAFALEQGGPVTNLLFAPLSAAVGASGAPIEAVYGTAPAGVFSATAGGRAGTLGSLGGGVGTGVVLATATVVTVVVVAVHLAVFAGPVQRRLVEARFAELPGVHVGPRPLADWRRADGGDAEVAEESRVDGGDLDGDPRS